MNNRGFIISKKYEGVTQTEEFSYQSGNYTLSTTIKIQDGIIQFDERKTHIRNLENILKRYYQIEKNVTYKDVRNINDNKSGFDGKEIYYCNYLASMGEVSCILVEIELSQTETISSSMIFLPQDGNLLTEHQKQRIVDFLEQINTKLFGAAFCVEDVDHMYHTSNKEEVLHFFDFQKEKHL